MKTFADEWTAEPPVNAEWATELPLPEAVGRSVAVFRKNI
jgi:hypothetical protein